KNEPRSASRLHRQMLPHPRAQAFTPEAQVHALERDVDGQALRDHCSSPESAETTCRNRCASKPASTRMATSPTMTSTVCLTGVGLTGVGHTVTLGFNSAKRTTGGAFAASAERCFFTQ